MVPCTYLCGKVHRCQLRDYIQGCIGNLQDSRPARLQQRKAMVCTALSVNFRNLEVTLNSCLVAQPDAGDMSQLQWLWLYLTLA